MDDEEELLGQIGLMLTQLNYSRHALEGIERATTRYAGIALSIDASASPLGSPPMTDGALRVYVVNIADLTAASSIGDVLSGLLGGAGRFLGGFLGSFTGGVISPGTTMVTFIQLARIVESVDSIMARIGNPSGASESAAGTGGPTLMAQLESVTALVREVTRMFGAASTDPTAAGARPGSPQLSEYFEPALALANALTRSVDAIIILIPMAMGAVASLLMHVDDIELAVLGLLEFGLRNVLLLRAAILATLLDTVAVAGGLAANVLGIVGVAVDTVIASVFTVIGSALETALVAIQVASTGIKNVVDAMMVFLRDGVGALLIYLGDLRVFRLVVHLAQVLPLVLPAIARIMDRPLSRSESRALGRASGLSPIGPTGPMTPPTIAAFPDLAALALPPAAQARLRGAAADFGRTLRREVASTASAGQRAMRGVSGELRATIGGLDANLGRELRSRTAMATTDVAGLTDAMTRARAAATAPLPDRGLAAIATAYEGWLTGGGFATIADRLNDHFRSLPTDAVSGSQTIPGRTVRAVLADRTDTRVVVEIDEVVIDLAPADGPTDPLAPRTAAAFDEEAYLAWQRDRLERGALV